MFGFMVNFAENLTARSLSALSDGGCVAFNTMKY